jgi:hypothetical protein
VTASDLAWVSQLPHLSRLSIPTKALSPEAGFDLRRLPQLRQLELTGPRISQAEVEELAAGLPECSILHGTQTVARDTVDREVAEFVLSRKNQPKVFLGLTANTDFSILPAGQPLPKADVLRVSTVSVAMDVEGLDFVAPRLSRLPMLRTLLADRVLLRPVHLNGIFAAVGLHALAIEKTGITAGDLAPITSLVRLERLSAGDNPGLTDTGIAQLVGLPRLAVLDVSNTGLTDNGAEVLATARQLAFLNITGTKVTVAGVARLQLALPDCEITSDFTSEQVSAAAKQLGGP